MDSNQNSGNLVPVPSQQNIYPPATSPNYFNMPAVNAMVSEQTLFENQGIPKFADVYQIVFNVLRTLNVPTTEQFVQSATNTFFSYMNEAVKTIDISHQQDRAFWTDLFRQQFLENKALYMQNAKLTQERKKTPRSYSRDDAGYGFCVDKGVHIKVGLLSIQTIVNCKIEKDGTCTDYKYICYTDSNGIMNSTMITLENLTAKKLVSHFKGFIFSCSKPIANEYLAWYINDRNVTGNYFVPERPGLVFMKVGDKKKAYFKCYNGTNDIIILEKSSDSFKKKILTEDKIQPDEITVCVEKYLNTLEKFTLFAISICAALSSLFEILKFPVTQILAISSPNSECTRQACYYLQVYNKGKDVKSLDSNITQIRKEILTAKDETVIFKDCTDKDNVKRRTQVISEILDLNHSDETRAHLTVLLSNHAQYQLSPEQRMNLTLGDDFYTRMTSEEELKMCYDLSRLTRFVLNVITEDIEKWGETFKNNINQLVHTGKGKDLPHMQSVTSYSVIAAMIFQISKILQIQDTPNASVLLLSMFQTDEGVDDCDAAIFNEFTKVINELIQNGSVSIEICNRDMNYDSNKPQVIVNGDVLMFNAATLKNNILPSMKLTNSLSHLRNVLDNNGILHTNKKKRNSCTVYTNGINSRESFIAVEGNEIIDLNTRHMIEAKKCSEWFADTPLETSFVPIVTNHLNFKAYQNYSYEEENNCHYFVLGASGTGKTHHLTERIASLVKIGNKVIVVDTSDSFKESAIKKNLSVGGDETTIEQVQKYIEEHITFHSIEKDGMPIDLFRLDIPDASEAQIIDTVYNILTAHKQNAGVRQKAELQNAIRKSIENNRFSIINFHNMVMDGEFSDSLSKQFEAILSQFINSMLTDKTWDEFFKSTKDIVVISFGSFFSDSGYAMVDMLLMSLLNYLHANPVQDVALVIDEVQNQNWNEGSPVQRILSEGRKYHIGLNYATQNLSHISKTNHSTVLGAGIKVFLRLDDITAKQVTKYNHIKADDLTVLERGECVVVGEMFNNKAKHTKPGIVRGYTYRNFVKPTDNE